MPHKNAAVLCDAAAGSDADNTAPTTDLIQESSAPAIPYTPG
jgi:hypothetical protein